MAFVQIIEFKSSRIDEALKLYDQWLELAQGTSTAKRLTLTSDRDNPNTYMEIVEFESYEEAMKNSNLPATQEISSQLFALCDGQPIFRNLDVFRVDER